MVSQLLRGVETRHDLDVHINGECRAGATFHTARKPTRPARPSVVVKFMNAGPVNLPRVRAVAIPPEVIRLVLTALRQGVISTIGLSSLTTCFTLALAQHGY
jgi:hypothetical protein